MQLPRPIRHLGGLVAMLALVAVGFVAVPGTAEAAPKAIPLYKSACARTIVQGDKDGCVTRIQHILDQNGYDLEVDGSFGSETLKRVKQFQKDRGLDPVGHAGPKTKDMIELWWVPAHLTTTRCDHNLEQGEKSGCVVRLQRQLTKAGFKTPDTGNFATITARQIEAFQDSKKLLDDGIVGPKTKKALGNPVPSGRAAIVRWAKAANNGDAIGSKTLSNGVKTKSWQGGRLPYSFGGGHAKGVGPTTGTTDSWVGIDCSGLARWAYALAYGKDILGPNASRFVETDGTKISRSQLQAGDLVYYQASATGQTMHVAVYIGGGKIIEATRADNHNGVRESNIDLPGLIISSYRSYV